MQLHLFDPTPEEQEKQPEAPSFKDRRRTLIEQMGGWWTVKVKDGHRIVEAGRTFWLTSGKKVGIVRVLQFLEQWQTAYLEAVQLTSDEATFGFGYEFWHDPEAYLSDRQIFEVNSFELWICKPPAPAKAQKKAEPSSNWVKTSLWHWFRNQNWKESDKTEMKAALETNDRLLLNNTYWFAQKQVGELAQKVGQTVDIQEFDFWFWKLLQNVIEINGDLPESPPRQTIQIVDAPTDKPKSAINFAP